MSPATQDGRFERWDRLAGSLPGDIDEIVEQVRAGKLGVDFRIHDSDGAVDHLVDGLVAAASVLASAQLISRRTGPTVGSISVPARSPPAWECSPGNGSSVADASARPG